MNSLERIGTTDSGEALFMFPSNGVLFYFKRIDYSTIGLHAVDCLDGAETDCTVFSSFDDLPAPVRRAISTSNYRMRSAKATLTGAMSHGSP